MGLISDIFVTSTNALTRDGKLVNADGSGNRVAAFCYGPTNVLVIVGINKIVEDVAYRDWETDRKSTRLNSSHITRSRMPSSA